LVLKGEKTREPLVRVLQRRDLNFTVARHEGKSSKKGEQKHLLQEIGGGGPCLEEKKLKTVSGAVRGPKGGRADRRL